jgi:predicted permease
VEDDDASVYANTVSDGYFGALGTHILNGRDFTSSDVPGGPGVVLINEALARKFFRDTNPVGKSLKIGDATNPGPDLQVVGVVEDTKYGDLREEPQPIVYKPLSRDTAPGDYVSLSLHSTGSPMSLIADVRGMMREVDPRITIDFVPLDRQVAQSLLRERMLATLSAFFGGLALILAVIGLYGTMSYSVARRRNEIGIRIALGSARERVMTMVIGEVGRMVAAGLAIGSLVAMATTKLVKSFLFGMKPSDPATLLLSCVILAVVALCAGALPAWRAARLDPMTALREE